MIGGETPRLVRYRSDAGPAVGIGAGNEIHQVRLPWTAALELLADDRTEDILAARVGRPSALSEVELLATIDDGDVYCVGLNYYEHQREAAELVDTVRDVPIIFAKSLRSVAAPFADLVLPERVSCEFDWEAELGVVIGHDARDVSPPDAWGVIAGYCVVNDITARDLQKRHQQWHLGKNIPGSTPVGPWVVGRHSLATPPDIGVVLRLNGVEKQRANTSALIHDLPELIALLSQITTLRTGDVIATGTPAGVGFKRTPPEYLQDGDVLETVVQGVGQLTNVVRTTENPPYDGTGQAVATMSAP